MVEEDETAGKTPEECRDLGLWEVDLVYYSLNGNNKVKINHVPHEWSWDDQDGGEKTVVHVGTFKGRSEKWKFYTEVINGSL